VCAPIARGRKVAVNGKSPCRTFLPANTVITRIRKNSIMLANISDPPIAVMIPGILHSGIQ